MTPAAAAAEIRVLADKIDGLDEWIGLSIDEAIRVLRACADLVDAVPRSIDCCAFSHVGIANYHRDGEVCPPQRRFEAALARIIEALKP
jgi:hypothetical protein